MLEKFNVKKIEIFKINKEKINVVQTLKCGQIFSYRQITPKNFVVFSADKKAEVFEKEKHYEIASNNSVYFKNFFDLETDYEKIKNELIKDEIMIEPVKFGSGIRILKQNLIEVIISFVFSANNNIKRITESLFLLRKKFGSFNGFFAFPTLTQLSQISENEFKEIGAGYRSVQLVKLIRQLTKIDFSVFENLGSEEIINKLKNLSGIGSKVADCIMLFGFNRTDVFPVDIWIEKAFVNLFKVKKEKTWSRVEIRKFLIKRYKNLSGYAQQYLFNYQRNF